MELFSYNFIHIIKHIGKKIRQKFVPEKNKFLRNSYSQSGEDLIVRYLFNILKIQNPSYLDIGAHHPYYLSNTALLYKNGSRGMNIEPDPDLFERVDSVRQGDMNLNIGIGETEEILNFHVMNIPTLNTFSIDEAESAINEGDYKIEKTIPVKVQPLSLIIDQFFGSIFPDFLSLDVEGLDELIIRSIDYDNSCPTVICVETLSFSENSNGIKNNSIIMFLEDRGYMVYADTYINTILVYREKWMTITNAS